MSSTTNYEVHIKATSKAFAHLISQTIFEDEPFYQKQRKDGYYLFYKGYCNGDLDSYADIKTDEEIAVVAEIKEENCNKPEVIQLFKTMRNSQKAELLHASIEIHTWLSDGGMATRTYYENDKTLLNDIGGDAAPEIMIYDEYGDFFQCGYGDYVYNKDEYGSFKDFLEEENLPKALRLRQHFEKDGDDWFIKDIGIVEACDEYEWKIK